MIDGVAFVVDSRNSTLHELSETGSFIWKLLEKGEKPDKIARQITDAYEVSLGEASRDVDEFMQQLQTYGLIAKTV
ncbi:MAG: hypothetical protein A2219_04400 [Elusimicrobia bacterium RIFOXYA2_FULL_50_26]|nr:MAG: hypothetical protein A2219_04400 [Elusimicrobia bacterium RIFOXYA2_FULL_50_26]OGS24641.1 MAG: hypothetical protein A2314_05825 [Elusimicrobia bacterium RIFOXYB2_FULL_50_12]